ncbi:MazG-like family protein [Maledivibacter halophilus]|uniref:MazG nucleotide pyrophosphohydrolase domain-containing protein n=1 Tax=Maledivibacter halophilus TaxID=36842 RepID=A0A1T5MID0_9FIRM|nr:MazG-like family protein [Maledivibacter halophilus]SKC88001.1 MazG nucleotide pyrophosphohydrolase domain-containing protein [Maledivibacter halophilus]
MKAEYLELVEELEELNVSPEEIKEYLKEKRKNRFSDVKLKTISLPYLNSISPTIESTALKLSEEQGELCRAIGKFRGMNGERDGIKLSEDEAYREITKELLDVAQTAITMILVLEKQYEIDVEKYVNEHIEKLINKGYVEVL